MKILEKELVREGTVKFTVQLTQRQGIHRKVSSELRIIIYPSQTMQVFSNDGISWLQSDLSEKDQKKLISEYKKIG